MGTIGQLLLCVFTLCVSGESKHRVQLLGLIILNELN